MATSASDDRTMWAVAVLRATEEARRAKETFEAKQRALHEMWRNAQGSDGGRLTYNEIARLTGVSSQRVTQVVQGLRTAGVPAAERPPNRRVTAAERTAAADRLGVKTERRGRPSKTTTDGSKRCEGACGQELPMTKFPTVHRGGEVFRGSECRTCQATRRAMKR